MDQIIRTYARLALGIFLISLSASVALAADWRGTNRLAGSVVDADKKAIANAKLMLRLQEAGNRGPDVVTDRKGKWAILGLAAGTWYIDIEAEGFLPKKTAVSLAEGQRLPNMILQLDPAPPPVEEPEQVASTVPQEAVDAVKRGEVLFRTADAETAADRKKELYREAIAEFEKALAVLPDHVGLKQVLARAYYGAGELERATTLLREIHAADPENHQMLLLLVNLLLESGQLEEGKKLFAKIPADALTEPTAVINIGILFLNRNDPAEAQTWFTRAVSISPDTYEPYYYRALAAIQLKRYNEAKPDLQKVLELAPDSPVAAEVKQILKSLG